MERELPSAKADTLSEEQSEAVLFSFAACAFLTGGAAQSQGRCSCRVLGLGLCNLLLFVGAGRCRGSSKWRCTICANEPRELQASECFVSYVSKIGLLRACAGWALELEPDTKCLAKVPDMWGTDMTWVNTASRWSQAVDAQQVGFSKTDSPEVVAGGVAANQAVRKGLEEVPQSCCCALFCLRCKHPPPPIVVQVAREHSLQMFCPPPRLGLEFTTDHCVCTCCAL